MQKKDFKKPKSKVTFDSKSKPKNRGVHGSASKPYVKNQLGQTFSKSKENNTGWGSVANWYQKMVEDKDSYQNQVILPRLMDILNINEGETILDLGCGVGYFCQKYYDCKAKVIGVDIGIESIENAKTHTSTEIVYHTNTAEKLPFVTNSSIDKVTIILALQNIKFADKVISEAGRVLKKNGKLVVVLNHPYFRMPKYSSWEWSPKDWVQFRKIEKYLSCFEAEIDMKPGEKNKSKKQITLSFHRPLEYYIQKSAKNGFLLENMEEWTSHRPADQGNKTKALEISRKEIPLFMCLVWKKVL